MHYINTTERQIIKSSPKYISNSSLRITIQAEVQLYNGILLLCKVLSA